MANNQFCSFVLMLSITVWLAGCATHEPPPSGATVTLHKTIVPSGVFTIADEAVAFRADGEPGKTQVVSISLEKLRSRVGGFNQATVYAFDKEGAVRTESIRVDKDGTLLLPATAGHRYLIYANLGERYRNTYELLCRLRSVRIPPERRLIPRICTQILCGPDVYPANELGERIPGMQDELEGLGLGNGPIGGFGGGGNICEQCLDQGGGEIFYPVEDCVTTLPDDPIDAGPTEEVVYVHQPFPYNAPSGNSQIYKMNADGSNPTNLSNNSHYDYLPDTRHDGQKIVFTTSRPGNDRLYVMDINGSNATAIPDTAAAAIPKWSRGPTYFVVFSYPANTVDAAIWRIEPNGSNKAQITNPGPNESDEFADVVGGKHIVFTRIDRANNYDRDLYLKYIWDNRPPVRLTNTSDRSETLPVLSHDGSLLAYRVVLDTGQVDQVHVANFDTSGTLNVLHVIDLGLPATINISGIDFSGDDEWLYISTQVNDVPGNLVNRFQEVFRVKLDGSNQGRLTDNTDADSYPSAIP